LLTTSLPEVGALEVWVETVTLLYAATAAREYQTLLVECQLFTLAAAAGAQMILLVVALAVLAVEVRAAIHLQPPQRGWPTQEVLPVEVEMELINQEALVLL
jgi:hypothetical protein